MKKKLFGFGLVMIILLTAALNQSEAALVYTLDVSVTYGGALEADKISLLEFDVLGGVQGTDWVFTSFAAPYSNWEFDDTGLSPAQSATDFTFPSPFQVLETGTLLTITSPNDNAGISISNLVAFDYGFGPYDFGSDPYQLTAQLNAVPIPSTLLLLGGGLVALVGIRRRRS